MIVVFIISFHFILFSKGNYFMKNHAFNLLSKKVYTQYCDHNDKKNQLKIKIKIYLKRN
jgi:hypothetical protein